MDRAEITARNMLTAIEAPLYDIDVLNGCFPVSIASLPKTDEVKETTFKHRIAEVHAVSMKRLSKVEVADAPSDGADDE